MLLVAPAFASAPKVSGRAYFVQNGATGEVLLERHARQQIPIASITKLMTVLVTLDHVRLDEVVTVDRHAAAVGEESIDLRPGDRLTVKELIEGALIQSANDAAVALADYVGGSESAFVAMMNAKAKALGLVDTHFANPDGLDQYLHYSSARDVTRLARVAMRRPIVRDIVRKIDDDISGPRHLHTWNDLLSTFPGLLGVKTGHTNGAGWSEVAAAQGRGVTVYATLLGEPSRARRNADLTALLAWGLSRYRVVPVIRPGVVYASTIAPYGRRSLALVAQRSLLRVVRIDRPLWQRVVTPAVVSLPVERGQVLGEIRIYAGSHVIAREPLVAARTISQPGFLGRVSWYGGRTLHHVWGWFS